MLTQSEGRWVLLGTSNWLASRGAANMTTIHTGTALTDRDIRRLERHGYEILTIETREGKTATIETFIWAREDQISILEYALPF